MNHDGPLAGVRVTDLTQFLAGPFATMTLGDLGAEVIKIETLDGDVTRDLPPHFVDQTSAYFLSANRNKSSVAVDLKRPEGQLLVRQLIAQSDVVVENFRPGVVERLGLNPRELMADDPALVWCSISGFGQTGPYASLPAYDMVVQAMSGGMSMTGEIGGKPVRSGLPLGDLNAGMFGVIGVLAALHERSRTGRGQLVDVAMLDAQLSLLSYQAQYALVSGKAPGPQGRDHESIPTYRVFTAAADTELVVTANTERMWRGLCEVLGVPELVEDKRFLRNVDRNAHRDELWALLEPRFLTREASDWLASLREAGVPAATVNDVLQALGDPQVRHRGMVEKVVSDSGTVLDVVTSPIKMDRARPAATFTYPPRLGQETADIFGDVLGVDPQRLAELEAQGVIRLSPYSSSVTG